MVRVEDYVGTFPLACTIENWLATLAAAGFAGPLFVLLQGWCGALAMACASGLFSGIVTLGRGLISGSIAVLGAIGTWTAGVSTAIFGAMVYIFACC